MAQYRPSLPFNVPLVLLVPTYTTVSGVKKKTFPTIEQGIQFFGTFKTYGGTERDVNGVYSVEDTATVETWFFPELSSGCRVAILGTNKVYDIIGEPENIELRNQFSVFKVIRIKGGA